MEKKIEHKFVPEEWVHKADVDKVVADETESCAGVLGFMLSSDLCKLVGDILPKAKEDVVPKARCKDVVVEARSAQIKVMTQESFTRTNIVERNKPYNLKLTGLLKTWFAAQKQSYKAKEIP